MKYERLTPEILLSDVVKGYNLRDDMLSKTFGGYNVIELIDRLVELENKIERGELVEAPKGAAVLTPEERAEEMRLCNEERKEAVKEFADEFKRRYFFMMATYMKNPIYQCTGDELDRLVKEVCGE